MPVVVDGEIYEVLYDRPIIPDDDRRRMDETWRQRPNPDTLYGLSRKRARGPASGDDDAFRRLLREARAGDAGMPEECAVCLQDFDARAREALRVTPCSHAFHPDCIFGWLRVKAVCPMCRRDLHQDPDFEDEEEDEDDSDEDDAANRQEESTPAVPDPEES